MLLGLELATWMEFYTYDGVNLVLPDMAGTFGLSQDQASWILTTYLSALLYGVPLSIWMAGRVGYLRYIVASTAGFAVAAVGCAMAPDFGTLPVWRAIQGFAGAGLIMWWRASVYMLFVGPQRSASLMRISVMLYLGTSAGLRRQLPARHRLVFRPSAARKCHWEFREDRPAPAGKNSSRWL